jgi:hypothetical protein
MSTMSNTSGLADQLDTVLKFVDRFWTYTREQAMEVDDPKNIARSRQIYSFLSNAIQVLRAPRGKYTYDIIGELEICQRQMRVYNQHMWIHLQKNKDYQVEYETASSTLGHVIYILKTTNLLAKLRGE